MFDNNSSANDEGPFRCSQPWDNRWESLSCLILSYHLRKQLCHYYYYYYSDDCIFVIFTFSDNYTLRERYERDNANSLKYDSLNSYYSLVRKKDEMAVWYWERERKVRRRIAYISIINNDEKDITYTSYEWILLSWLWKVVRNRFLSNLNGWIVMHRVIIKVI